MLMSLPLGRVETAWSISANCMHTEGFSEKVEILDEEP